MKHPHRDDLPKGHIEEGESERECALRELREETGLHGSQVELDDDFCYRMTYYPKSKRYGQQEVEKELVVFLGRVQEECEIVVTEHVGFEWVPLATPETLHKRLAPVIEAVRRYLDGERPS